MDNVESNGNNKIKCTVNFVSDIMQGTEPQISGSLVPVEILDNGTVLRADETTNNWYDYSNRRWANAVILIDETQEYGIGREIPESNIESYFVWIPKYRYKLWNVESTATSESAVHKGPFEIEIILGDYDTSDSVEGECENSQVSGANGKNGNCQNGDYMTHPAFTALGVKGLWVGKFETGYNQNADPTTQITSIRGWSTNGSMKNIGITEEDQITTPSRIIIKPNVYSWTYQNIKQMFETAYYYKRDLDSHMMKNTEWGAIAYLSHSIYGTNKNVSLNNSWGLTGAVSQNGGRYDSTWQYPIKTYYKASTTGNISGIFDMVGCQYDFVMGFVHNNLGNHFTTETETKVDGYDKKYFDVYNENSARDTYQYRILGDATGEMGPHHYVSANYNKNWYNNSSNFITSQNYIMRGDASSGGTSSGLFSYGFYSGDNYSYASYHLVLAPQS